MAKPPAKPKKATKPAPKRRKVALTSPDNAPPDDVLMPTGIGDDLIPGSVLVKYTAFVADYLETGDAPGAALRAGYVGKNPQAQKALGARLLENPHVRALVSEQYTAIIAKSRATPERIWQEIAQMAFADIALAYDAAGEPLPLHEIPEHVRRAITGYKVEHKTFGEDGESITRELKFAGKEGALDKLMKLHRMVDQDKLVILDGEDFLRAMEEGRARAAKRA